MEGKRHGQGTYTYANGDVYNGEWVDDKKHGQGIYQYRGYPCQLQGVWQNGQLTNGGTWRLHDNSTYTGGM